MSIQRKHVVLWIVALLVLLCAMTATAYAVGGDYTRYPDGCIVDESDPNHKVLARYEGTLSVIPSSLSRPRISVTV